MERGTPHHHLRQPHQSAPWADHPALMILKPINQLIELDLKANGGRKESTREMEHEYLLAIKMRAGGPRGGGY